MGHRRDGRHRRSGSTHRVSLGTRGNEPDYAVWSPVLSADGRIVAASSNAHTLVPHDTNSGTDLFVWELP